MTRLSSRAVVFAAVMSFASGASAQDDAVRTGVPRPTSPATLTCNPAQIHPDSYRLTTEAQALNYTQPRTDWWDGFDATLQTHRNALADFNGTALMIAERAAAIDSRNLMAHSQIARQLVIDGAEGDRARATFREVFNAGGAVVWTATMYDVDALDFFLMAFDRNGIRVFRFGEAVRQVDRHLRVPKFPGPEATTLWIALGGCLDGLVPEAEVPWSDVHEIKAGNYVVYFKFNTPVTVRGDRGKRKTLRQFKVALHGAMGTVEYLVSPGRTAWDEPSVRGIGIGPTAYQDRVRRTLVAVIDPQGRIKLPKASRGAGW